MRESTGLLQWVMMARGIGDLEKMFWRLKFGGHTRLCAELAFVLCNLYLDELRSAFVDDTFTFFAYCWMEQSIELLDACAQEDGDAANRVKILCGVSVPDPLTKRQVLEELASRGLVF